MFCVVQMVCAVPVVCSLSDSSRSLSTASCGSASGRAPQTAILWASAFSSRYFTFSANPVLSTVPRLCNPYRLRRVAGSQMLSRDSSHNRKITTTKNKDSTAARIMARTGRTSGTTASAKSP